MGQPDLDATVRRLQAYEETGAHVLYAPGITTREEIGAVVTSVGRPVNVVMGLRGDALGLHELSELGVKRISVGSALARAAAGAVLLAAEEMQKSGTFTFAQQAIRFSDLGEILDAS